MPPKEELHCSAITFSEMKNGSCGISLGNEKLFVMVFYEREEYRGKPVDIWKLQLLDLEEGINASKEIRLNELTDLRTPTQMTRGFRAVLKARYKNWENVIEMILIQIDEHESAWKPEGIEKEEKERQTVTAKEKLFPAEEEVQAALVEILAQKNHLKALKPYLDNLIVGEEQTKITLFVLMLSCKYPDPSMKQMILLKGTEGGGKSLLMSKCSTGYRIKEVGRFSQHALDYTDFSQFEVLLLKELGTMDDETQGISTLKFLSSEDKGYTVEITGPKNEETGRFTTLTYTIPAMTMLSSTTRMTMDKQLERRAWLFNVDETVEQTKKILDFKVRMRLQQSEKDLGLRKVTDAEFATEVIKRYVEGYQPVRIVNPFLVGLSQSLGADKLRVRADIDKLFNFVSFYAMFNIARLITLGDGLYLITPQVLFEALKYVSPIISRMVSELDERAMKVLNVLKDMEITDVKDCIRKQDRDIIAAKINRAEPTVRKFLGNLEAAGYISGSYEGKTKVHILLYDLDSIIKKTTAALSISTLHKSFMEEMLKEAQKWLEQLSVCWSRGEGGNNLFLPSKNVPNDTNWFMAFNQYASDMLAGIPDMLGDMPESDMPLKADESGNVSNDTKKHGEKKLLVLPPGEQQTDDQQRHIPAPIQKGYLNECTKDKRPIRQFLSDKSASIPEFNKNITVPVFEGDGAVQKPELLKPIDLSTYEGKEYPCPECAAKGCLVLFMDRHKLMAHRNEHGIFDGQICDACGKLGPTIKVSALHLCVDCEPKPGEN